MGLGQKITWLMRQGDNMKKNSMLYAHEAGGEQSCSQSLYARCAHIRHHSEQSGECLYCHNVEELECLSKYPYQQAIIEAK